MPCQWWCWVCWGWWLSWPPVVCCWGRSCHSRGGGGWGCSSSSAPGGQWPPPPPPAHWRRSSCRWRAWSCSRGLGGSRRLSSGRPGPASAQVGGCCSFAGRTRHAEHTWIFWIAKLAIPVAVANDASIGDQLISIQIEGQKSNGSKVADSAHLAGGQHPRSRNLSSIHQGNEPSLREKSISCTFSIWKSYPMHFRPATIWAKYTICWWRKYGENTCRARAQRGGLKVII